MAGEVLHVERVEGGRVHEAPVDEGGEDGEGGVDVGRHPEEPVAEGQPSRAALSIAVQHVEISCNLDAVDKAKNINIDHTGILK